MSFLKAHKYGENDKITRNFNIHIKKAEFAYKIFGVKEVRNMMTKQRNIVAIALEKIARNSIKAASNSRCVYCLHQPKQPKGVKQFVNDR